ncbi:hypothetical protein CFC21_002134 [Triticum aestivum]|uniref:Replication factor A C-terminal domain-containing protein n=1 Tax=Triticum aestivum TaxID=4565 RepID=A0A3B5XZU1_WHEAT|nr:hypothetical protein CFC21_002134 [Triticum aestivum]
MSLAGCGSGGGAAATWTPPYCTIVAAETSDFSYLSCPTCGRACGGPAPARAYRLLLSVATHDRVFPVVLFDRAARALLGCSADELARLFAAADALHGEMCRLALREPTKDGAEHLRAVSVVPLRDGFRPVVDTLRTLYSRAGG